MELSFQILGLKLCALIGAVLDLTARPIGERKVRAAKPRSFAVSGGACDPHAPAISPAAERVWRRVEARTAVVFQAVSSAVFAAPFPASFWSQMADPRSGALLPRKSSVFMIENLTVHMIWFLISIYLGGLVAIGVSETRKMVIANLLVNAAMCFLCLVVRRAMYSSTETSVAVETVSLTFVAKRGNFLQALKTSQNRQVWIVDSGASDHMTDNHKLFTTYIPCAGNMKVKIADGSLASIAGKGSIKISESITLESVLHVSKLACSLLSVSQLTQQSNCAANFLPTYCVFQELSSGMVIGHAKECEGLYFLDDAKVSHQPITKCSHDWVLSVQTGNWRQPPPCQG